MALTSRVWGAGKLLVLLAALGATYLLSAFLAVRMSVRASEVTVPDLAGRSVNDASARLDDLGSTCGSMTTGGPIRRCRPARSCSRTRTPGSHVRRQRSIHVWVSPGEEVIVVPSLVGDSERSAAVRLAQGGLKLAGAPKCAATTTRPTRWLRRIRRRRRTARRSRCS